jgi:hypothetical protein
VQPRRSRPSRAPPRSREAPLGRPEFPRQAAQAGKPPVTIAELGPPTTAAVDAVAPDLLWPHRPLCRAPGELDILLDTFPLSLSLWSVPMPCACIRRRQSPLPSLLR